MRRRLLAAAAAFAALAAVPDATVSPAFAHAQLRRAVPPVDGTVAVSPAEIVLSFSEAVEPRFSTIEVKDRTGARVDNGPPHLAGDDGTRLAVALKTLPPGDYTVVWHATSVDTHRTEGRFRFTVGP